MTAGFDVHDLRHRLKQVKKTADTELYRNRDGVACPACGEPFDELLLTTRRQHSFDPDRPVGFCVVREDDRLLVATHRPGSE